ncbi:hypothetical protein [Actinacidiphila epipremni]|uniref:Uncharacterized protein n=1 Tax=Actinacidiphila epipremni TaxID=2053013 RepID=A0ABX0ZEV2_9ACTN|nr:hypothetical protein [Actinacidiphila epipremni]NJP42305.1 hypothetical protein [Actinacidiphila epipremni]
MAESVHQARDTEPGTAAWREAVETLVEHTGPVVRLLLNAQVRIAELEQQLAAAIGTTYREAAHLLEATERDDDAVNLLYTQAAAHLRASEDSEPETPAGRAAREIQDLHDPAVIGYLIGIGALRLILHPRTWQEWQDWQRRLGCLIGEATYRGGTATAHGLWRGVPVVAVCHLDRLPKLTEGGEGR